MTLSLQDRTIRDFGCQWTSFQENPGYYASVTLFEDIFSPLLKVEDLAGNRVADIGSGTGRIVNMLVSAGAANVLAIEPSAGFSVLKRNVGFHGNKVRFLNATGEQISPAEQLDFVFSVGVLHHIPQPEPVVRAACNALRPGGKMGIWLYSNEGNRLFLTFAQPLRHITRRLPDPLLWALVWAVYLPLLGYANLCKLLPLPLRGYLVEVWNRFDPPVRRLVAYDQLNPAYAKYYTRDEAYQLLAQAGFVDIRLRHRHGYSWTVVGTKPS